jgi:hypothetical protein
MISTYYTRSRFFLIESFVFSIYHENNKKPGLNHIFFYIIIFRRLGTNYGYNQIKK